jgi:AAA15 family ATPase/GTPase
MIISITIENCLSFKDATTISFKSDTQDNHINRSVILFGANGSGKSNFVKALVIFFAVLSHGIGNAQFRSTDFDVLSGSFKTNNISQLPSFSFFNQGGSSKFTIEFKGNKNDYRFILSFDQEKICHEELCVKLLDADWLMIYSRDLLEFDSKNNCWQYQYQHSEDEAILQLLFNKDQLNNKEDLWNKWKILTSNQQTFLVSATTESCYQLREVVTNLINMAHSIASHPWLYTEFPELSSTLSPYYNYVINYLGNNSFFADQVNDNIKEFHPNKKKLLKFLGSIGNRFDDIGLDQFNKIRVIYHQHHNDNNPPYFVHFESSGTIQALLLYQKFHQAISNNMLLIIDEIEVYLHANVCEQLIRAFNEADSQAQLIITSQSPLLCNDLLFSREQIHFVERNAENATEIYRLTDIQSQEKKEHIMWKYLGGQFGAVPDIDEVLF